MKCQCLIVNVPYNSLVFLCGSALTCLQVLVAAADTCSLHQSYNLTDFNIYDIKCNEMRYRTLDLILSASYPAPMLQQTPLLGNKRSLHLKIFSKALLHYNFYRKFTWFAFVQRSSHRLINQVLRTTLL